MKNHRTPAKKKAPLATKKPAKGVVRLRFDVLESVALAVETRANSEDLSISQLLRRAVRMYLNAPNRN